MNIGWVRDYTSREHEGGAEMAADLLLLAGRGRGLDVRVAQVRELRGRMPRVDIWVYGGIKTVIPGQLRYMPSERYVLLLWDVWPEDAERAGVPYLCERARLCVFQSPGHVRAFRALHGPLRCRRQLVLPTAVCVDGFQGGPPRDGRPRDAVWMGLITRTKGWDRAVEWAEKHGRRLDIYGRVVDPTFAEAIASKPWATYCGILPHARVPQALCLYRTLVIMPRVYDACPLVVWEAVLSGCEVVADEDLVGNFSWDWDVRDPAVVRAKLSETPARFWDAVLELVA